MGRCFMIALLAVGMIGRVPGWGQETPARVNGGVMAGRIVERSDPIYPPIAKAAGVSGAVVLRALIDETGHVTTLNAVSGPEMLRAWAMEAVRGWVFNPYFLNGRPAAVDTVITVNFQLAAAAGHGEDRPIQEAPAIHIGGDGTQKVVTPMVANIFCGSPVADEAGYHQRVSGGVMQGLLEKKVDPLYPQVDASGAVVMMVCVDAVGAVEKVRIVSGPAPLRDSAGRAVSEWRYRPYLLNGVAVLVSTTVTVTFSR